MNRFRIWLFIMLLIIAGCTGSDSGDEELPEIAVNSLEDSDNPPEDEITLRSALASAQSGQRIVFDPSMDGGVIELSIIGEDHSILKGEVMGMENNISYLVGYLERDYGKSALYARKNVVIDASDLPSGITLEWTGGDADPARVIAVYGNLTLINVTITGGASITEEIPDAGPDDQPWTLGRGGAVAVWGTAKLTDCVLFNNHCEGDALPARDRGSFGAGIYADIIDMENCVVSGNSIDSKGAAGGGVYAVGGAGVSGSGAIKSSIRNSSITGNRISGVNTYGGGVYSDGGGIGKRNTLELINCTIAANIVEPWSGISDAQMNMGYWRGGGVYASNGYLTIHSSTIVQNEVYGQPRTDDLDKANLAGGVAATVGNAHAVEDMVIGHSIIAGNRVIPTTGVAYDHDIFTGSLLHFKSLGHNRIGVIDFSKILVPVGEPGWNSLSRKHYPKQGDMDGVDIGEVLNLATGITRSDIIVSAGVDAGNWVPLYYEPMGEAVDQVPSGTYSIQRIYAEYKVNQGADNFLPIFLSRVESHYDITGFAAAYAAGFELFLSTADSDTKTDGIQPYTDPDGNPILTLADTLFFGPAETWPRESYNYPYIKFWHRFDEALAAEAGTGLGTALINDLEWDDLFSSGPLAENPYIVMKITSASVSNVGPQPVDQTGTVRPSGASCDIGAIERN